MSAQENCENAKLVGYDPTGESALPCNEPGEYCPECELVRVPRVTRKLRSILFR